MLQIISIWSTKQVSVTHKIYVYNIYTEYSIYGYLIQSFSDTIFVGLKRSDNILYDNHQHHIFICEGKTS